MTDQLPDIEPHKTGDPVPNLAMTDPALAQSAYKFGDLAQYVDFAKVMCKAGEMLPPHCRMNPSICLALVMRSVHWGLDPFGIAQETYQAKPGGPIGYQAKVFTAVLRNNGVRLRFRYEGTVKMVNQPVKSAKGNQIASRTATGDRKCVAFIVEDGEELAYETLELDAITIKNSPLWHNDPDQQLAYAAGRGWARRYRPDLILGAYDDDEVRGMAPMRDVTPKPGGFTQKALEARERAEAGKDQDGSQEAAQEAEGPSGDDLLPEIDLHTLDLALGSSKSKEWEAGIAAYEDGKQFTDCPYATTADEPKALNWCAGWTHAHVAADVAEQAEA